MAFGVSGVVTKPWANAREHGIFGFIQGLGTACLGFIVQPVSGILDFVSLTVHGVGASCTRFFEIFENKSISNRIKLPRAIRGNGQLEVYDERAARGQVFSCIIRPCCQCFLLELVASLHSILFISHLFILRLNFRIKTTFIKIRYFAC